MLANGTYQYNLKDHLGNTRAMFSKAAGAGQTSVLAQATDYYPFGKSFENNNVPKNRYLYNGKELQEQVIGSTFFGWYDYGARFYDPEIARWHSVDPLAEDYESNSPFAYVENNPIYNIDPDGQFSTKFGAWLYKIFNGGTVFQDPKGEWGVHKQVENTGDADATVERRFDWSGRSEGKDVNISKENSEKKNEAAVAPITIGMERIVIGEPIKLPPWAGYAGSILRQAGLLLTFISLTGDTNENDKYIAPPRDLKGFPGSVREKRKGGRARWRLPNGDVAEWDSQHGEVEVYDKTGKKHKGAFNPETGEKKKDPEKGRKTNK